MGTGTSFFRNHDEDDVLGIEYDSGHGVIKRIPIEVKPRGRLGLRSVGSFGRKPKGGSLRSALSVDMENPEVERIRKDYEMYRLNKDSEIQNLEKKEQKFETENKRLRAELQALQKTCTKLRNERDAALEAEHQALARAAAFENDRDKVQRQFKIFRETKESEIQNLLRNRRDLETKVTKLSHGMLDDCDTASKTGLDTIGGGNPGDWWTALESEPSLGSTTQLHQPVLRGLELAHSVLEMDGPFTNVTKEDWNIAAASLAHITATIPETALSHTIKLYVSAPRDMQAEINIMYMEYESQLRKLCELEGRAFLIVHMMFNDLEETPPVMVERLRSSRLQQIKEATVFLAFLGEHVNRFTVEEYNKGHLDNPGNRPAIFCFRDQSYKGCRTRDNAAEELKGRVRASGSVKIIENYTSPNQGMEMAFAELQKIIKIELGIDVRVNQNDGDSGYFDTESPEQLCGGGLWDIHSDFEQMEALSYAVKSSCELGFEKYYERLNAHVAGAGPLPPLLISGGSGSGRSLLLSKWIHLVQERNGGGGGGGLVLYHFVGNRTSSSADPLHMIRRLTAQLMQQVATPPALTCDPVRLVEEFPRWLEKVSSKIPGGVILVLDSIDRFQQAEVHLKWLLDPLPVDSRVVVSAHEDHCPASWRSWPTLHVEPLSNKNVKELLRAELASRNIRIHTEQESRVLTHCRTAATCNPLYVMVLAAAIASCENEDLVEESLDGLLETGNCVELYRCVLDGLGHEYEDYKHRGILDKILRLVLVSRSGCGEWEIIQLIPEFRWNYWAPLRDALIELHIISYRAGLIVLAHEQTQLAVEERSQESQDKDWLKNTRDELINFYQPMLRPGCVTCRVADELPWLIKQAGDKEHLSECLYSLCIFERLYARGRCAEIISYWQYVGADKTSMAESYFSAAKQMENAVGQFDGLVTLPRIADVYEALGRFLRDLGLLTLAVTPLQRALELRETALDPDHPMVAQSLHQLASLHAQWNKFPTAEALYKQALEIYENAFGKTHHLVAKELDALAVLYQKQDRHEQAEPLHRRAVLIRKKYGNQRVGSANRGVNPLRRRTLQLEELAMGPDSADLAKTLNEIGVLYYLQNNTETAESFFKRALEMRETTLDPDHPDLAQSLNNLAALHNDRKQYELAETLYERALQIRRKCLPSGHQGIASIVKHLAVLYKKLGKFDKAKPLYRQAVEIRERSFGATHPAVATALVNLAVLYCHMGVHGSALPLYERALRIFEDSLGGNHPRVAETLRNMAVLRYEQGDYENAARLYKRATEIRENESGYAASKIPSCQSSSSESNSTMKNGLHQVL